MAKEYDVNAHTASAATPVPPVIATTNIAAPANIFTIWQAQEAERNIKMLVYGASGVGKTYLAATAQDCASLRDVLYIDAEAGSATLLNAGKADMDIVNVQNWQQLVKVYEFLYQFCRLRDDKNVTEEKMRKFLSNFGLGDRKILPNYKTVIIDTVDEVQDYCMKSVQGINPQSAQLNLAYIKPGWPEYGEVLERMRLLVRNFRNLPLHVVMTCHQEIKQDENQRMLIAPSLVGKFAVVAQAYFDFVAYYVAKTQNTEQGPVTKRRLYIAPGTNFAAKNRCNAAQGWVDNPTMEKILNLLDKT